MAEKKKPAGKLRKLPAKKVSAKDATAVKGGIGVIRKRYTLLRPSLTQNILQDAVVNPTQTG